MRFARSVLSSIAVAAIVSIAGTARAQEASPTGKGVIGGALLGGELVLAIEAAFDVQSPWAYIGGGVAGAAAGGVGGYFIEKDGSARVPMLMLAGGMAFAIPTTVAVLSATAYEPPASYVQDQPVTDEPVADPPRPVGAPPRSSRARDERRTARLQPPALIDFEPRRVTLSIPSVSLHDVFTREEVATLGVQQATELRVPVVNVLF
jgi:hypothetical protein